MILQALKEYGERNAPTAEEGVISDAFADGVAIHWLLEIDTEGNFLDLHYRGVEQRDEKGKKKPDVFPPLHKVPKEVINSRSSGGNPQFLADNLEYYFGISDSNLGTTNFESMCARSRELADDYPADTRALAVKKFFEKLSSGKVVSERQRRAIDRVKRFFDKQPSCDAIVGRRNRILGQVAKYFENLLSPTILVGWDEGAGRGKDKLVVKGGQSERRFAVKKPKERIALCLKQDNLQPVFHTCENLRRFWSKHFQTVNEKRQKPGVRPPCICCGKQKPVATTFDQFDGLPGGKTYLICYGKDAFHSYGFQDGENASLCFDCMKSAIRGMNELLKSPSTHKLIRYGKPKPDETEKIAPVMFAFWPREPAPFDFGKVSDADPESVKKLLESVRRGVPSETAANNFYILGFSRSSKLRTLVRYWSETNVKEVEKNLGTWFEELNDRLTDYGPSHKPQSFIRLCQTTVRQPEKFGDEWKFPPAVSTGLFLSAFLRKPVPPPVLQLIVNRVRTIPQTDYDKHDPLADYKFKPARMALLRLTLNRLMKNEDQKFDVGLDVSRREPEYHCGRLLAVCDNAMRWANGTSTVADRYMGSASTAPCSILPVVYRNSRHHLNKLKRDRPGTAMQLEKLLDEILSKLTAYPVTLPVQKAGTFILGFHHQRQYFFLVSRYRKLKEQAEKGALAPEDKKELEALGDFVRRSHFDVSLLADLPDEEAPPITTLEAE
jgi:CRISPR-associated protein Csd1